MKNALCLTIGTAMCVVGVVVCTTSTAAQATDADVLLARGIGFLMVATCALLFARPWIAQRA
jgi:hypothetical protein